MKKKLTVVLAAMVVTALAVPAFAVAAPSIESEGELLPVGSLLLATSTNLTTKTSIGTFACAKTEVETKLTENSGTSVKMVGIGSGKSTTCTLGGKAATVSDITWTDLSWNKTGTGTVTLTWETGYGLGTCHYEGTKIPFTYTVGGDSITLTNATASGMPFWCQGTLNGTITLRGVSGKAVVLN